MKTKISYFILVNLFCMGFSFAQQPVKHSDELITIDNNPNFFRIKTKLSSSDEYLNLIKNHKNLKWVQYKLSKSERDTAGFIHKKYTGHYKEMEIEWADLILHYNNSEELSYVCGYFNLNVDTTLRINISLIDAWQVIKNKYPSRYTTTEYNSIVSREVSAFDLTSALSKESKLKYFNLNSLFIPAYQFVTIDLNTGSKDYIYINASNGEISLIENCITSNIPISISHYTSLLLMNFVPGSSDIVSEEEEKNKCDRECFEASGNTTLYGIQPFKVGEYKYDGFCKWRLMKKCDNSAIIDTRSNDNTVTNSLRTANNPPEFDFTDQTNFYGHPNNKKGVQTHWALERVYEYYKWEFNRNSMDNANNTIDALQQNTSALDNASFDPTNFDLIFGGKGSKATSEINSLDIIGHEFAHGVIHFGNSSGFSNLGEAAALDESFADIFGEMFEFYVKTNFNTGMAYSYLTGNEVYLNQSFSGFGTCGGTPFTFNPVRDFTNPNNNQAPNTYGGIHWLSNCSNVTKDGGHINGQVQNYWFFLTAEGGSGTNDNSNAYCVTGIGKTKATHIAYNNMMYNLFQNASFNDSRTGSILSAINLYGANSDEVAQVTAAWYAVGVGPNYSGSIDLANYTTNGNDNYTYNCKINVYNYVANSSAIINITSNDQVHISPNTNLINGATAHIKIAPACFGGARLSSQHYQAEENIEEDTFSDSQNPIYNARKIKIFPNPVQEEINLEFEHLQNGIKQISIYNSLGVEVKNLTTEETKQLNVNVQELPNGVYFIQIKCNELTENTQLIKL